MGISDYIKNKKELKLMPFMTVYLTIIELIKDGYLKPDAFMVEKDV